MTNKPNQDLPETETPETPGRPDHGLPGRPGDRPDQGLPGRPGDRPEPPTAPEPKK
jgi:hypothetical protein